MCVSLAPAIRSLPALTCPLPANLLLRYLAGEDILTISANVDFPPCMMMRRMLESLLHINKQVCVCREEGRETGEGRRLVHNGADRNGTMPSPTSPAWPPAGYTLQPASFQPTSHPTHSLCRPLVTS